MDLEKHLIELSETPGVSGYEPPVRAVLQAAWEGLADEISADALGSLTAVKRGSGPAPRRKVLITGHMDEIGLMVTRIDGDFLRISNVGGIDRRVLLSQPVIVHGSEPLPGLIGSRPPHVLPAEERGKYPALEDLVVDTGHTQRQLEKLVRIGAPVTFDLKAASLGSGLVTGKAMDNRVSCAALTGILHRLQRLSHEWDVLIAATVQEEYTLGGGQTVAWRTQPDLAIVIDTGWATGNGVSEDDGFKLGGGPTLVVGPNAHPKLTGLVEETAKRLEIPTHPEVAARSSGTEAWAVQVSRDGVPCAILSIPIRNMHTPVEMVAMQDIERVVRLVTEVVSDFDDETLGKLALD
jgi:endoglucanase